jgi:glycosyltransferase involved in cell wall biosynthesis
MAASVTPDLKVGGIGKAMSKPYVSVLIDTCNHERFIAQAIASVLGQEMSMEHVEIIVVDDGSTDGTPEIVRRFEPRVRLIRKNNGGQASAFNAGIPECHGEIVAFLDGDDWWAPGKLRRVVEEMEHESEVGIVGNGIIQVFDNGEEHSEVLHTTLRFRIDSVEGAKIFRRRKSQLGTSRMTVRAEILRRILPIPESIIIEADEYIFTVAAAVSDVSVIGELLTFYRIHAGNLFQVTGFKKDSVRRKQKSLDDLASALSEKLLQLRLKKDIVRTAVEAVQAEADQLRLQMDGGFPWETVRTEWKFYRIVHEDASISHQLFKIVSLIPALVIPPRLYYGIRRKLAANEFYLRMRRSFFPIPQPQHVTHSRRHSLPGGNESLL